MDIRIKIVSDSLREGEEKEINMTTEQNLSEKENQKKEVKIQGGSSDTVYGLGLIGAWIYYIGRANTTEDRIKGFLKGLVWPVFLVSELFEFLNKE